MPGNSIILDIITGWHSYFCGVLPVPKKAGTNLLIRASLSYNSCGLGTGKRLFQTTHLISIWHMEEKYEAKMVYPV
jgi:hypothetical protein